MWGIIFSHRVNLKLALRFHAMLIVTILSLKILFCMKTFWIYRYTWSTFPWFLQDTWPLMKILQLNPCTVWSLKTLWKVEEYLQVCVVAERSSALDSSSGVVRTWVRIPAWPVAALVSSSKTLNHNCFVLRMGRKAVGPVRCVMHVKEPRTLIVREKGLAPVFLESCLEHPAGWICARLQIFCIIINIRHLALVKCSQASFRSYRCRWENFWPSIKRIHKHSRRSNLTLHCPPASHKKLQMCLWISCVQSDTLNNFTRMQTAIL